MKITYHTNLDIDRGEVFSTLGIPSVGDIVVSNRGLELEVVRRKWYRDRIEIELWLVRGRFNNCKTWFEKWYREQRGM